MNTRSASKKSKKPVTKKLTTKQQRVKVTSKTKKKMKVAATENDENVAAIESIEVSSNAKSVNVNAKEDLMEDHSIAGDDLRPISFSEEAPSLCNLSPDILMQHILPFVGKNQYRFVGAINRHFRLSYLTLFSTTTTYNNVRTMEQAYICSDELWKNPQKRSKFCKIMVQMGHYDIVKYMFTSPGNEPTDASLTAAAAESGHFDLLRWLVRKRCTVNAATFAGAAAYGDLNMFEWLYKLPRDNFFIFRRHKFPWDDTTYDTAALHGHLHIIEWAHKKQKPVFLTNICSMAARNGHLHVLRWAHAHHHPWGSAWFSAVMNGQFETLKWLRRKGYPLDPYTCHRAAEFGHGQIAKWAASHGCPLNAEMCDFAAENGNLEMLKIAHDVLGVPFGNNTFRNAVKNGHLHVLKWLHANGCEWDIQSCQCAALKGHFEVLKWLHGIGCPWFDHDATDHAAEIGRLDILQWALANGCRWSERTCAHAASGGHLNILKWLRANGCPWDGETYYWGIYSGYLHILEWAYSNGCPITGICTHIYQAGKSVPDNLCSVAASFGQLDVLQWARSHDMPWSDDVCSTAAYNRDLEVLDWALANGCPFPDSYESLRFAFSQDHQDVLHWFVENDIGLNSETCARAALEGNFKFFRWLHRHECPWDERSCANAMEKGHIKILEYARRHRCPSERYPIDAELPNCKKVRTKGAP